MNENSKIYVVLGAVVAFIAIIIGFNIYTEKQSEKIYNNFNNIYDSESEQIVLLGHESCQWCKLFQPILDFYKQKYTFDYTYIETGDLVEKHFSKILEQLNVKEDDFGTPLMAFVKSGKVTEIIYGYIDEKILLEKLKEHQFVLEEEKDVLSYLDLDSLKKTIKSKQRSIIVVGQTTCSYCIRFKPVLMKISDGQNIKIHYINYDEVKEQDALKEYLSSFDAFKGDWGTPLTIIVENGKVISEFSGYAEESTYLEFLKENNLINK